MIRKVISGGQTGVDRAGLDTAREAGLPIGGYCAKGRLTEDGTIPEIYPVLECKIRSTLDTQSDLNWTPNPERTGHSIRF